MKKPVVLIFAAYYIPGYKAGGPIRTLVNMTDRLGDDFEFYLVTRDRDLGDSVPYDDLELNNWALIGNARVRYLAPHQVSFSYISRLVNEICPDVVYLNSFFNPHFTQRILWLRFLGKIPVKSIILAPRGEFSSGALGLKSLKKRIYIVLSRWLGVYRNITWQASSSSERQDIKRVFRNIASNKIRIAMNLAPLPNVDDSLITKKGVAGSINVCFLSRISPMKNLDFAIKILKCVNFPVTFTIYGPLSDLNYWNQCKQLIDSLPSHVSVTWKGDVKPLNIRKTLAGHDLFFLPTRGENYGHVIHEALSSGVPVLISDQTPWNSVNKRGVGWALPLTEPQAFVDVIESVAGWDCVKRESVFYAATNFANEIAQDKLVLEANRQLFLGILKNEETERTCIK